MQRHNGYILSEEVVEAGLDTIPRGTVEQVKRGFAAFCKRRGIDKESYRVKQARIIKNRINNPEELPSGI